MYTKLILYTNQEQTSTPETMSTEWHRKQHKSKTTFTF